MTTSTTRRKPTRLSVSDDPAPTIVLPPVEPIPRPIPRPRRVGRTGADELLPLAAAAVSSFALVWIVFDQLTSLAGVEGFVICWYAGFLGLYWLTTVERHGRMVATDRVISVTVTTAMIGVFAAIAATLVFVLGKGIPLLTLHVLTHSEKGVPLTAPAKAGGVAHAIIGTLEEMGIAVVFAAPAGILTAVFLNEVGGPFTRVVRVVVTAMAGVPTIVAGIFIYSLWIVAFGFGFSGFAGALALAVVILPSITRTTEEVLKTVDDNLRQASTALGAPAWRTTFKVVLPAARSGIVTAVLLGMARAVGETAPLLVTIFGAQAVNTNPFHNPQEALPFMVYEQVKLPLAGQVQLGFAAAVVLILIVLLLFVVARIVAAGVSPRELFARRTERRRSDRREGMSR